MVLNEHPANSRCMIILSFWSYEPENCIPLQSQSIFHVLISFSLFFNLEENMVNFYRQSTCSYVLKESLLHKLQFTLTVTNIQFQRNVICVVLLNAPKTQSMINRRSELRCNISIFYQFKKGRIWLSEQVWSVILIVILSKNSAERGYIRLRFLVWNEILHYKSLLTRISYMYYSR